MDFRILPLENRLGGGKQNAVCIELLRANRERVVWLDDDEAHIDESLARLADLLVLQPDSRVGLTLIHLDVVDAYLDGEDEARLIGELVASEHARGNDQV